MLRWFSLTRLHRLLEICQIFYYISDKLKGLYNNAQFV